MKKYWKKIVSQGVEIYEHTKYGTQLLHLPSNDNPNNSFCVFFKTPPVDSTGVFHVLEHSTLEGPTKNYDTTNVFFSSLSRSLNSFMNAWTGEDWTAYLFSTYNEKDLENLMNVYLDCVFMPKLSLRILQQEGHRFVKNPETGLYEIQGVVYNEMKGGYSEQDQHIYMHLKNAHFNETSTYSHESGGDPRNIPDLTFEKLFQTHLKHYHPSKAKAVFIGDEEKIDAALRTFDSKILEGMEFLKEVGKEYLNSIENDNSIEIIKGEKSFKEVRKFNIPIPSDSITNNKKFLRSKRVRKDIKFSEDEEYDKFLYGLLEILLFDNPRGIMYKELIQKKKLGLRFSDFIGSFEIGDCSLFCFGLEGIERENENQIIETINKVIEDIKSKKIVFNEKIVNSILDAIEINKRKSENDVNGSQINKIHKIIQKWNYNEGDKLNFIIPSLENDINIISKFRNEKEKNKFLLNDFVEKMFDDENICDTIFYPVEKFDILSEKEEERIKSFLEKNHDEIELSESEENVENNPSCLPIIIVEKDIERERKELEISQFRKNMENNKIHFYSLPEKSTSGITFFSLLKEIPVNKNLLSDEEIEILPLVSRLTHRIGTGLLDEEEIKNLVNKNTGGIYPSFKVFSENENEYKIGLEYHTYCLDSNTNEMLETMRCILNESTFENKTEKIKREMESTISSFSNNIVGSGMQLASNISRGLLYEKNAMKDRLDGIEMIRNFSKHLKSNENLDRDCQNLLEKIWNDNFGNSRAMIVTSNEEVIEKTNFDLVEKLIGANNLVKNETRGFLQNKEKESFFEIDSYVNFLSLQMKTGVWFSNDEVEEFAKLEVLGKLIEDKYLYPKVRFEGGAYGTRCNVNNGLIGFQSYRDPNFFETINIFKSIKDWYSKNKFSDEDLNQAKLKIFQRYDLPLSREKLPRRCFLSDRDETIYKNLRKNIFDVSFNDLDDCIDKYFVEKTEVGICGIGKEKEKYGKNFKKLI